jgi:hypothetical protein
VLEKKNYLQKQDPKSFPVMMQNPPFKQVINEQMDGSLVLRAKLFLFSGRLNWV